MSVLQKVTAVVAEVLEVEPDAIAPDQNLLEELGMDSVLAIDIVTELEKFYQLKVPDERMEGLVSVRAIAELVEELQASRAAT